MAVGTHWEWRAFGTPTLVAVLRVTEALDKHFGPDDPGKHQVDEYLVTPNTEVNVKLREGALKFKRRLEVQGGFELWTELDDENFPFPLQPEAFEFLEEHMGLRVDRKMRTAGDSLATFRGVLDEFRSVVRVVPVAKHRIQYELPVDARVLLVELAEIKEPERTWSICIEGENLGATNDALARARDQSLQRLASACEELDLPGGMRVEGYMQWLSNWFEP